MAYANYDDYKNIFFGESIPEDKFGRLSERASEFIDLMTFNRLRADATLISTDVIKCVCAIADKQYSYEQASQEGDMQKTSEKVGDYSVSYSVPTDSNGHVLTLDEKKSAIVRQYLSHTGLLYRGW